MTDLELRVAELEKNMATVAEVLAKTAAALTDIQKILEASHVATA